MHSKNQNIRLSKKKKIKKNKNAAPYIVGMNHALAERNVTAGMNFNGKFGGNGEFDLLWEA